MMTPKRQAINLSLFFSTIFCLRKGVYYFVTCDNVGGKQEWSLLSSRKLLSSDLIQTIMNKVIEREGDSQTIIFLVYLLIRLMSDDVPFPTQNILIITQ